MGKRIIFTGLFMALLAAVAVSCGDSNNVTQEEKAAGGRVIETGEVLAVHSWNYILPRFTRFSNQMKIIGLLEHGTLVRAGDSIMQFDPAEINKNILSLEDQLATQTAALEKMQVDQDNTLNDLESSIKSSIASFDLKKIELEASKFEPEKIKRIKELEFRQAEITLEKEKSRLEYTKEIIKNDLFIQKIRVNQIKRNIESYKTAIPQLTVRTPVDGVLQLHSTWTGGRRQMVKVGDNVYQNNLIASVPEIKWMKIETQVNETDFRKLRIGQKVAVRLDAMPKIVFDGEVSYIGKLCRLKGTSAEERQKVFDVEVRILAPDERLKPGMTVSCEFL